MDPSFIKDYAPGISALLAVAALFFAVYQYRLSRALDKAKFSAEITERFYKDDELAAAWFFIDLEGGDLWIPVIHGTTRTERVKVEHSHEKMATAFSMRSRHASSDGFYDLLERARSEDTLRYVAIFDRLFSFVESLYGYYVSGAIDPRHITNLLFMLMRLSKIEHEHRAIFTDYLVLYEYSRVTFMIEIARQALVSPGSYWTRPKFLMNRAARRRTREIHSPSARLEVIGRLHP